MEQQFRVDLPAGPLQPSKLDKMSYPEGAPRLEGKPDRRAEGEGKRQSQDTVGA